MFALVLLASLVQGLLDVFLVALLARLVGLLAGSRLEDYLPGIKVFGGGFLDQSGWLVALLIASFWLASGIRFAVALMQSLLSAEVWNDLVNKVYDNLMRQKYDFFIPVNYNTKRPKIGKGSAIFIHLTKNFEPTFGCVALKKKDFLILLKLINKKTKIKLV